MRPVLSNASAPLTHAVWVLDERQRPSRIEIPAERALTLYLDKHELVTLMTLGSAPEALVLGYLRNQRLISALDDIVAISVDWEVDAAAVTTSAAAGLDRGQVEQRTARRVVTSGCGQGSVFGGLMDALDAIALPTDARLAQSVLYRIVDSVRNQQSIYKRAGSLHACALFSAAGAPLYFIEDVGRHNAVDTIAGKMWLDDHGGADKIFYTTGRLTSEMVIKCAQMGIPILLSRSGTTQMGLEVAKKIGITLLSRCTGTHFLLLCGNERLLFDVTLADF